MVEPEICCSDCHCYKCNVVECGRSLCAGKVNAAHAESYHHCFTERCTYFDTLFDGLPFSDFVYESDL